MKRFLPFFFLLLGTCGSAQLMAQAVLTGTITDQATGEPLPFASIYVQETKTGSASNANGQYNVKLAPGTNNVVFQYLGYQTLVKQVSGNKRLDVKLNSQALELGTVEIISGGEDISYSVIRRAIAKADYHLNQVESYEADVYIKGTGKLNSVGGAIRLLAGKEGREEIDESIGQSFTSESTSRVYYTRPNNYRQEVIQSYSVGDEQIDASQYVFSTFYQPLIANSIVSPLHPRAFGYYKYEQIGTFIDQDQLINKIRVTPRSRGEDVFEGFIYIVQDDWSIHSLDLTTPKLGFDINIKQNYAAVQEHVWMPITSTIDVVGGILGIKFEYHYLSTIGDYSLSLNPALKGYVEVIDEKTQPEIARQAKGKRTVNELEEALGNGESVTRKDLRRLMKTYKKEDRKEREEPEVVSNYSFVDSSAVVVRDSAAWKSIRPVPLTIEEVEGYAIADSIYKVELRADSATTDDDLRARGDTTRTGKTRRFKMTRILPQPIFNPVQGYIIGADAEWTHNKKGYGFGVLPSYSFGTEEGYLELSAFFGKSGIRETDTESAPPRYRISGGQGFREFNEETGIDPWLSTYLNLLSGRNFTRLYKRQYLQFDYAKAYGDEFSVDARLAYEDRSFLLNQANNNWSGLDDEEVYTQNTPINNAAGRVSGVSDAATFRVGATWMPGLKYRVYNGRKELIEGSAPEIGFQVRQGIPDLINSTADFTEIQASYLNRFDIGRKGKVQFLARGGYFLNNGNVDFPDFRHFAGSEVTLVAADPLSSYRLLPYYAESTNEEYLEVYAHYQFRKFLLTQITELNLFGLREDLFVNYLYTPTSDNYTEVGYSLDKIFRVLRLEFVASFRDGQYDDFGVRFGVATSLAEL
ncbi:DUF5686 and carboxypeptidase regulatory-like domain-containing protein [Lewinella sp. 4G2]|uniref:DUF5686 and carboxypeptidase regulatory-like domain-containing protein n=1 Tax=Lewinella sp. 4G2 TaxID=1803372 RepID=UPI0007B48FCD|nr:DUF5686 and carboxypeptidase regulatory-like domain-containing protein [Lewinella sp. 4G2]OAV43574.1 hypothetical protein A3850_003275 [Lewinella sp. 4G2]